MKRAEVSRWIRRAAARFGRGGADPASAAGPTSPAFDAGHERGLTPLFVILLVAVAAISYSAQREIYLDFYDRERERYLAGTVPTTRADAYYWFRAARDVRQDAWQVGELDTLRAYPDGIRRGEPPLIARSIARVAEWTDRDIYAAGQLFALATSCLFVFPLAFFGLRIGHPAAGLVAAGFAAACPIVFTRTAIYHVDTDALNLFGLWSITLAIAYVPDQRSGGRRAAVTLIAALATALFVEWYDRALFYVVFCAVFPFCLWAGRLPRGAIVGLTVLFAIAANPLNLIPSLTSLEHSIELYVSGGFAEVDPSAVVDEPAPGRMDASQGSTATMDISQNDLMSTIAEGQRLPLERSLTLIGAPAWLVAVELVVFLVWSLRHWRRAVVLLPIALLGLMGLLVSNRFLIFLAPLAGLGLGLGLSYGVRGIAGLLGQGGRASRAACVLTLPILVLPLFVVRPEWAAQRPFSVEYIRSLKRAARHVPAGSPVWSTWGHGYLLQEVMGAATFRDGLPDLEVGHFYLKGLTGDDPRRLARTIAYLQNHPQREVRRRFWEDYSALDEEIAAYRGHVESSTFLLLTEDSMRFFASEHQLGQWSPDDGWPAELRIPRFYCFTRQGRRLQCAEPGMGARLFDLSSGTVDGSPGFGHVVVSRGGSKASERRTRSGDSRWLELITEANGSISVYPMRRAAYLSLVNRMYALGEFDEQIFELVYDDFPHVRLYRFRMPAE